MDIEDATEQYMHLLENHKKTLAKAKLRKGQRPHDRKPKKELYDDFMLALMFSRAGPQTSGTMIHSSFVPPSYHPCIKSFADLKPIAIKNLRLETYHRGTYLLLRSLTPPYRMTAIMAVMEDGNGDAVKLQIYQQEDEEVRKAADIINIGTIMIVKEPYYKVMGDGEYGVRIDHLSDVVTLRETDKRIPEAWKPRFVELDRSAESLKSQGNMAMSEGRYWDAINDYSNALSQPATTNEIEIIKRNRSLAYLKTKHLDAALADTGFPDFNTKTSDKALFRAAEALYYLRQFEKSCEVLHLLCNAYSDNKRAKLMLDCAQSRVQEQKTGNYNFKQLQVEAKKFQLPQLDHASYNGPIEVRQTESHGRGVFVTKAVNAGDLLLCEKAFSYAYADKEDPKISLLMHLETNRATMGTQADLIKLIVHKLHRNPSIASEFTTLYHGSYEALDTHSVDSHPVVDTFLVDTIMSFNVFGCPASSLISHKNLFAGKKQSEKGHDSCGIWTQASYINHCCTSTARRAFIGDMMVIRASRDMEAGTEITFWYHSPISNTVADLQKKLDHWGFVCDCAICEDGRATSATIMAERKKVLKQAKHMFNTAGTVKTNRIERVLEGLEKTYSKPADEVPRVQLWDPSLALAQVYAKQHKPDKSLEWVAKVLNSLGFIVAGADSSPAAFLVVKWGLIVDQLVVVFLQAKDAFMAIGTLENSRQAEDYARLAYKITVGEDSSFSATYE